jgi:hypothetical protein
LKSGKETVLPEIFFAQFAAIGVVDGKNIHEFIHEFINDRTLFKNL